MKAAIARNQISREVAAAPQAFSDPYGRRSSNLGKPNSAPNPSTFVELPKRSGVSQVTAAITLESPAKLLCAEASARSFDSLRPCKSSDTRVSLSLFPPPVRGAQGSFGGVSLKQSSTVFG